MKWSEIWIGGVRDFELTGIEKGDPILPGDSKGQPDTKMDIRGKITTRSEVGEQARKRGIVASVLVEGVLEKDTGFDRAHVKITERTRILKSDGEALHPVTFEALKTGQRVEARFIGPVAESYPVQAMAGEIVILED